MIETATPSPQPTPEAPRAEATPSFLDQMGRSVKQFTVDIAKANDDAREQLGRTAVGHMLSGVAPLATGVVGEVVLDTLLTKRGKVQSGDSGKGKPNPFLLFTDAVSALNDKPFLKEVAKNVGVTVAYNQMISRPSEGALPPASAVDAGVAVGLDAVALGAGKLAQSDRVKKLTAALKRPGDSTSLRVRSINALEAGGKTVTHTATLANGPTVLGLRMMGEGIKALIDNYQYIQRVRKNPNEPKPYRPPEAKPWERRDRGSGRDFRNRDRVYYGQGRGRDYNRPYERKNV